MKKVISVFLVIMLFTALASLNSYANFGQTYTAPKGTPEIDGQIDSIWDAAEWTDVDQPYDGADRSDVPESLRVKLLWDEEHLYVLAEVKDLDLNYDNDLVEVYLDETNQRGGAYDDYSSQTRFRWDGSVIEDSGTNCQNDADGAGVKTDDGWILEISLKWTSGTASEGQVCGLEFMFNIGDSSSDFTSALRWNVDTAGGEDLPFRDNTNWGVLTLGAAPAVAETSPDQSQEQAPQTMDILVPTLLSLAAAAGIVIQKKRR